MQLFNNCSVNNAYLANEIPKLVLIDKKGNIVSLKAPLPSYRNEIDEIIGNEIVSKILGQSDLRLKSVDCLIKPIYGTYSNCCLQAKAGQRSCFKRVDDNTSAMPKT